MAEKYLSQERVSELWSAVIAKIASELTGYVKPSDLSSAITTVLSGYATTNAVKSAIEAALTDYMTTEDVTSAITAAISEVSGLCFQVVSSLPSTGKINTIYLVPNGGSGQNAKDEYMWIDEKWEKLGSTDIDLSQYWKKTDLQAMTSAELAAILV